MRVLWLGRTVIKKSVRFWQREEQPKGFFGQPLARKEKIINSCYSDEICDLGFKLCTKSDYLDDLQRISSCCYRWFLSLASGNRLKASAGPRMEVFKQTLFFLLSSLLQFHCACCEGLDHQRRNGRSKVLGKGIVDGAVKTKLELKIDLRNGRVLGGRRDNPLGIKGFKHFIVESLGDDSAVVVSEVTFETLVNLVPANLKHSALWPICSSINLSDFRLLTVWNKFMIAMHVGNYVVEHLGVNLDHALDLVFLQIARER